MPPRYDPADGTLVALATTRALNRAAWLAERIHDRIAKRLGGRVRGLDVQVEDKAITLRGRCATYYTKQLAQHAALGVLEDETLVNAIVVAPVVH
ncbi:hypothetical protein Pla175_04390 [Pirellulimonas nuda]|uniref:BON domain-containing protein n=1 Tax=Pirellulimonas nuda TaxID=2528009 RepID=A0A518D6H4_9BACT|nr:BON domain-containing protein [Pirellulimonas nuda]QDU87084.1 hypothetical protein Pla175_04390 [Pirellulimonas nuda]